MLDKCNFPETITLKVGDIIKTNDGFLYEIKANGTYIDFKKSIWLEVAEECLKNKEIVSVYRQILAIE